MKILVTAGPTREFIDPVRYISNRSSGKMGYALAREARRRGHEVTLISGPVSLQPPVGVKRISVVTAADMLAAVRTHLRRSDALIMAAAVADYRPMQELSHKRKKSGTTWQLVLAPTTDILRSVAGRKGKRIMVGFAAETQRLLQEARRKLTEKNLDMIVANDVRRPDAGFDVDTNRVVLISRTGECVRLPLLTKTAVARHIVRWVEQRRVL